MRSTSASSRRACRVCAPQDCGALAESGGAPRRFSTRFTGAGGTCAKRGAAAGCVAGVSLSAAVSASSQLHARTSFGAMEHRAAWPVVVVGAAACPWREVAAFRPARRRSMLSWLRVSRTRPASRGTALPHAPRRRRRWAGLAPLACASICHSQSWPGTGTGSPFTDSVMPHRSSASFSRCACAWRPRQPSQTSVPARRAARARAPAFAQKTSPAPPASPWAEFGCRRPAPRAAPPLLAVCCARPGHPGSPPPRRATAAARRAAALSSVVLPRPPTLHPKPAARQAPNAHPGGDAWGVAHAARGCAGAGDGAGRRRTRGDSCGSSGGRKLTGLFRHRGAAASRLIRSAELQGPALNWAPECGGYLALLAEAQCALEKTMCQRVSDIFRRRLASPPSHAHHLRLQPPLVGVPARHAHLNNAQPLQRPARALARRARRRRIAARRILEHMQQQQSLVHLRRKRQGKCVSTSVT